jgi:solute carrier family 41
MLNNLKGNLEMNLSSRLSTAVCARQDLGCPLLTASQANIGDLDLVSKRRSLILGNLSLLQVQALLVSAVAAVTSFGLGKITRPPEDSRQSLSLYGRIPTSSPQTEVAHSGLRESVVSFVTGRCCG